MRWPEVAQAIVATLEADAEVMALVGGPDGVLKDGDQDFHVKKLLYKIVGLVQTENWEPCRIQFTWFTRTDEDLVAGELALARLFGIDGVGVFAGLEMMAQYANGSRTDVEGLSDGIRGSSTDYIFTPKRSRYVWAAVS